MKPKRLGCAKSPSYTAGTYETHKRAGEVPRKFKARLLMQRLGSSEVQVRLTREYL